MTQSLIKPEDFARATANSKVGASRTSHVKGQLIAAQGEVLIQTIRAETAKVEASRQKPKA